MSNPSITDLATLIAQAMRCDQHRLNRSLKQIEKNQKQGKPADQALSKITKALEASCQRRQQRAAALPKINFPDNLPVSISRDEIAKTIQDNQVVVIAGETGSGKTTQLPKICLEIGRGVAGYIGHTQPRRIAARTVASRIAEELQTPLGEGVGYKIRFQDKTHEQSYIKLMTDGILLAEIQNDPFLNDYDTLIIDEAHERSLNIDFLLGYLKQLLPKRPDLKVIITSATIDTERFASHFGGAPVLSVSGRTYPVEVRYRPYGEEDDRDQLQAIADAVDELGQHSPTGDILVFLPTEREIRETTEFLRKRQIKHTELLPLFSRLSPAEQNRVFQPHSGRRIVLSTNVAETSLTVPGIRFVIDPGTARISRYSYRSKVQRLPIEKVSQASANQRKGRCGRVADGICIRLYSEEDFLGRPEFTEPEIQRTNLANVILQMASIRIGDIEAFPFPNPPEGRYINDGKKTLFEIGALDKQGKITELGRQLSKLPIDARIARMLLGAVDEGCLEEVTIIASALSVRDPRERPLEAQQKADEAHRQFEDETSDFLSYVNLWQQYHEQAKHLTKNKLKRWCEKNFLSFMRIREWLDIHSQLLGQLKAMKLVFNRQPAEPDNIHRALLTGLLSHIAMRSDNHEFTGARNRKLKIFPSSVLFKKSPKWLMAAEVVETSQTFARTVAGIQAQWVEPMAKHLITQSYFDAHWEKKAGQVAAYAKVNLYGLTINPKKRVNYGPINPKEAREIFIRSALVEGQYRIHPQFLANNLSLVEEIEALEHKSRRQDIVIDDYQLFQFYDQRIPEGIYSAPAFEKWLKKDKNNADQLLMNKSDLMRHDAESINTQVFPDHLQINGVTIPLSYHFDPLHPRDGVSATLPIQILNQVSEQPFEWLVPGLIREKLIALLKGLPKQIRRNFVPIPQFVEGFIDGHTLGEGELYACLEQYIKKRSAITLGNKDWTAIELPKHLQFNFIVIDNQKQVLGEGRQLLELQQQFEALSQQQFKQREKWEKEKEGITEWDFADLQTAVELEQNGLTITAYPTLIDQGETIKLTLVESAELAKNETRRGIRRLFMLQMPQQVASMRATGLKQIDKSCLFYSPLGRCQDLKEAIIEAAFDMTFISGKPLPQTKEEFTERLLTGKSSLMESADYIASQVYQILELYQQLNKRLKKQINPAMLYALSDIKDHLHHLVYRDFLQNTPTEQLRHLIRYIKGIMYRIEKLENNPQRDRQSQLEITPIWETFWEKYRQMEGGKQAISEEIKQYRWQLEELRISLFAQELGTAAPVSAKRLKKQWADIHQK